MTWEMEVVTYPSARKEYPCEAWPWIDNAGFDARDFSEEEWGIIEKARLEKFSILKGTKYLCVRGKWEGEFYTYRARLDMQGICNEHKLQEI